MNELNELREENAQLKIELAAVKKEIALLQEQTEIHPTMATGKRGERMILDCISAILMTGNKSCDLITHDGRKIEVKTSNPVDNGAGHFRWQWGKVTGQGEKKKYERIFLIGKLPFDKPGGHQIFDVPSEAVAELCTNGGTAVKQIQGLVKYTPHCKRRRKLLESCLVSEAELQSRYRSANIVGESH